MQSADASQRSSSRVEFALEPNRDDISSGMLVVPSKPILDDENNYASLLCFPFYLVDESTLPPGFQGLAWVLHSAMCHVQKGEKNAFMDLKDKPFHCQFRGKNEKPIIIEGAGLNLPEMQLEIRILSMEEEHYLVLVARTHLSFSLRHAIIHTLSQSMSEQIDDRRVAMNSYAQRIRETIGVSLIHELERGDSIDWMKVSNEHSFTTLFSVRGMVHWIACDYQQKHPDQTSAHLEGFGCIDLQVSFILVLCLYV